MPDSAPDYAVAALDRALEARGTGGGAAPAGDQQALVGDAAISLPALQFRFKSPSFLGNSARWVLFIVLLLLAFGSIIVAWAMVARTHAGDGAEWVWPPLMALVVAAVAIGFAYAAVMGFGDVDVSTSIGAGSGGAAPAAPAGLTVTSTVPGHAATDVAPDVQLEAVFSEAIDEATLTTASYRLRRREDGSPVAGTVALEDGTLARFTPEAALAAGTAYEAQITTDVTAASGAVLETATTWTFTTTA